MKYKLSTNNKKTLFYIIMVCIPLAFFCVLYIGSVVYRGAGMYNHIKSNQRGWRGIVHTADAELGFSPIPNSYGYEVFPIGPDVPMRYDKDGFRVPVDVGEASKHPRPLILALGCSFTYGAAAYAEDTFPYLVGQYLEGTSKNAGVCSYGLSQILLLAKKLLPIYKPDYLLVQYSPWLVARAQYQFSPTYFGRSPAPFFYEKGNSFALNPPVFLAKIYELEFSQYQNTPPSLMDKLSFFWNVGFPLLFHDDSNMLRFKIDQSIGRVPKPTKAKKEFIEYVYREINEIASTHGAKLVIVGLGLDAKPIKFNDLPFPTDAILVNAHEALLRHITSKEIPINDENYKKEYSHWRGSPPRVVDDHPNEVAHKIIAEAIAMEIRKIQTQ
jgi:hypothetical protein